MGRYKTTKTNQGQPDAQQTSYKVMHNTVNNLACTFHNVRYPLKRGITILEGIGRVRGENAIQAVLVRFRGHANKLKKSWVVVSKQRKTSYN